MAIPNLERRRHAPEVLAGVVVAALVAAGVSARAMAPRVPGAAGEIVGLAVVAAVGFFLYRAARAR